MYPRGEGAGYGDEGLEDHDPYVGEVVGQARVPGPSPPLTPRGNGRATNPMFTTPPLLQTPSPSESPHPQPQTHAQLLQQATAIAITDVEAHDWVLPSHIPTQPTHRRLGCSLLTHNATAELTDGPIFPEHDLHIQGINTICLQETGTPHGTPLMTILQQLPPHFSLHFLDTEIFLMDSGELLGAPPPHQYNLALRQLCQQVVTMGGTKLWLILPPPWITRHPLSTRSQLPLTGLPLQTLHIPWPPPSPRWWVSIGRARLSSEGGRRMASTLSHYLPRFRAPVLITDGQLAGHTYHTSASYYYPPPATLPPIPTSPQTLNSLRQASGLDPPWIHTPRAESLDTEGEWNAGLYRDDSTASIDTRSSTTSIDTLRLYDNGGWGLPDTTNQHRCCLQECSRVIPQQFLTCSRTHYTLVLANPHLYDTPDSLTPYPGWISVITTSSWPNRQTPDTQADTETNSEPEVTTVPHIWIPGNMRSRFATLYIYDIAGNRRTLLSLLTPEPRFTPT